MAHAQTKHFNRDLKRFCDFVEQAADEYETIKVKRPNGKNFVILSEEEWNREQETMYILRDTDLVRKIAESTEALAKSGRISAAG